MGTQKNIRLSGTVENIIYYQSRGGSYVRSKPARVKQSKATRKRSTDFGKAATMEKIFRGLLADTIPHPNELAMQRRFRTACYQYLIAQTSLSGFSFSDETKLSERLKLMPKLVQTGSGNLLLQLPDLIPAKHIVAPAHSAQVLLHIGIAYCSLEKSADNKRFSQQIAIPFNHPLIPAREIMIPFTLPTNGVLLLAIGLRYYKEKDNTMIQDKRWLPAGIIQQL